MSGDNDAAKPVPVDGDPQGDGLPPPASIPPASTSANPSPPINLHGSGQHLIGKVVGGGLELDRLVGSGGTGDTYEANAPWATQKLAVKMIAPPLLRDPEQLRYFRETVKAISLVRHPAVLDYRQFGIDAETNLYWLASEYIDGITLSDEIHRIAPSPAGAITLLKHLAGGIKVIHDAGILHRDISPDNIMLRQGDLRQPVLIDFGIAALQSAFDEKRTIVGVGGGGFAGRIGYAAPETFGLFGHGMGPATDIFSLGAVAFELATGRRAFPSDTFAGAIEGRLSKPDLSGLPSSLAQILSGMLEPDPDLRIRDAGMILDFLENPPPTAHASAPAAAARRLRPGFFDRLKSAVFGTTMSGPHGPGGSEDD